MKASTKTALQLLLVLLLLALGAPGTLRQSAISRLRLENAALAADAAETASLTLENQNTAQLRQVHEEFAKLHDENSDLPRLRNEARQLRRQAEELAKLRAENQRLSALAVNAGNSSDQTVSFEGFIPSTALADVGLGSPELTVRTFFWALSHNLTNRIFEAMAPPDNPGSWWTPENVSNEMGRTFPKDFIGFRIAEQTADSPNTVTLRLQSSPHGAVLPVHLKLVGAEWKVTGM